METADGIFSAYHSNWEIVVQGMVYNVPLLTGTEITPQEIKMLSDEDVVHSVKWSHLEVSRIHDTRLLCGPNFPIFAGIDVIAFEAMTRVENETGDVAAIMPA